jgi:hypothetical protein
MITRRLAPLVLLGAVALAGCSGEDPAPAATVTITETPSSEATSSEAPSSEAPSASTSPSGTATPSDGATTGTGDEAEFVREVLDDSPALDRIVEGDLVKIGRQACDTLTSGGTDDIAEQGLRDGSTQFSADEAEDIVDAAEDHLC